MTDTLPRMYICKNCGFMSMRGQLFEAEGDQLLCMACIDQPSSPFCREATEADMLQTENGREV